MNTTNLMPAYRQQQLLLRIRLGRWKRLAGALCATLVLAYVGCCLAWSGTETPPVAESNKLADKIARSSAAEKKFKSEISQVQFTLDSARAVAQQPDVSILLASLSKSLSDETFLYQVKLKLKADSTGETVQRSPEAPALMQKEKSPSGKGADRSTSPILYLAGFAKSQAGLSRFVRKLEETEIFEKVTIVQNSSQPLFNGDAVGFKLECPMVRTDGEGK
jgi:hypothetical protein